MLSKGKESLHGPSEPADSQVPESLSGAQASTMKVLQQLEQLQIVDKEDEDKRPGDVGGIDAESSEEGHEEMQAGASTGVPWWASSSSRSSEDDLSTKDYTACSASDCGYCGHCGY